MRTCSRELCPRCDPLNGLCYCEVSAEHLIFPYDKSRHIEEKKENLFLEDENTLQRLIFYFDLFVRHISIMLLFINLNLRHCEAIAAIHLAKLFTFFSKAD